MRHCAIYRGGVVQYGLGLALQEKARKLVSAGIWDGIVLLLEHEPVITLGRRNDRENMLISKTELTRAGIEVAETQRGGNVTCHSPGQLVGYPVLDLGHWQRDLHWYLRRLEEALILTLIPFGLRANRKEGFTGVWLEDEKVAAIGVYVQEWVTSHGFALNVKNDLRLFDAIVPCGISDFGVTSLARRNCPLGVEEVAAEFLGAFARLFDCTLTGIDDLEPSPDNGAPAARSAE